MVDFTKLRQSSSQAVPIDPLHIFNRLPKPQHINDLWESQSRALADWHERRNEKDVVIKLNTGGGKTLVGLLIAQSLINELHERALFLCANNQLVDQTIEKATEVGLSAVPYVSGTDLSSEFLNSSSILVGTYPALFNGLSKFGVRGSGREPVHVGAIICDDAHTAFSTLRDVFTISIRKREQKDLYREVVGRFRTDFEDIGRIGTFDDIVERDDFGILEVPYTAWSAKAGSIRELLARDHYEDYKFQLPLLRDRFDTCHALISFRDFAITSFQPIIELFPTFEECPRRIYMSATIADDSSIIRTFDAGLNAALKPIAPPTLAGVGERMILAPVLMALRDDSVQAIKKIAPQVAKQAGVVILVPSEQATQRWKDIAEVALGDEVAKVVTKLLLGKSHGPYVLANRYDGIDLVGDACRLLVMDGLPRGANTYDLYRAEVLQGNSSINVSLAQRIEQGLGRATRGAGDFCVIFLAGRDLISWITRVDGLRLMTSSTQIQIQMGNEISKAISNFHELVGTVNQCLKRDREWMKYHAETLAERTEVPKVHEEAIRSAKAERTYLKMAAARNYEKAISTVREHVEKLTLDRRYRGWLLQLAAAAAHYWGNQTLANELQQRAFAENNLLLPPKASPPYEPVVQVGEQAENILRTISGFALRRGCLEEFDEVVSFLTPAATSNQFEESLKNLGEFMGFKGQRPERDYRVGPDVLWLAGKDTGVVIECKHQKAAPNPLTKEEHGQLLTSVQWFKNQYPKRGVIEFGVHPSNTATPAAAASDTRVLTLAKLGELTTGIRQMLDELCSAQVDMKTLERRCAELLKKHHLTPELFVSRFLAKFVTVGRRGGSN